MIYVVTTNRKVLEFDKAKTGRVGKGGNVLHLFEDDNSPPLGSIPLSQVKYWGPTLPPQYKRMLQLQTSKEEPQSEKPPDGQTGETGTPEREE